MSGYRVQDNPSAVRDSCTLWLAPSVHLLPDDLEAGFRWIRSWDVAMPLRSYTRLARDFGDEVERAETLELVLSLAQPVYDERVLFTREGSTAEALLEARTKETCEHEGCPLPMLRAVWKAKPLILALPAVWVQEGEAA